MDAMVIKVALHSGDGGFILCATLKTIQSRLLIFYSFAAVVADLLLHRKTILLAYAVRNI
jgi:hypothetical protein